MTVKVCFAPRLNKTAIREETLKIAVENMEKADKKKEQIQLQKLEEPVEQVHTHMHTFPPPLTFHISFWELGEIEFFHTIPGCVYRHCLSGIE